LFEVFVKKNGLSGTCPERSIKKQKENRRKK
jgi:hypothetical protein